MEPTTNQTPLSQEDLSALDSIEQQYGLSAQDTQELNQIEQELGTQQEAQPEQDPATGLTPQQPTDEAVRQQGGNWINAIKTGLDTFTQHDPQENPDIIDGTFDLAGGVYNAASETVEGVVNTGLTLFGHADKSVELPGYKGDSLLEPVTRFTAGFAGLGWLSKLGWFAKAGNVLNKTGKAGQWIGAAGKGFLADYFTFDGNEERLSNLIESNPRLHNPITEFLQARPDDPDAIGRLKNGVEGLGLGVATDSLLEALKLIKTARVIKQAKGVEAAEEFIQRRSQIMVTNVANRDIKSAQESAQVFERGLKEQKALNQVQREALDRYKKATKNLYKQTGEKDLVEGQKALGAQINGLETQGDLLSGKIQDATLSKDLTRAEAHYEQMNGLFEQATQKRAVLQEYFDAIDELEAASKLNTVESRANYPVNAEHVPNRLELQGRVEEGPVELIPVQKDSPSQGNSNVPKPGEVPDTSEAALDSLYPQKPKPQEIQATVRAAAQDATHETVMQLARQAETLGEKEFIRSLKGMEQEELNALGKQIGC